MEVVRFAVALVLVLSFVTLSKVASATPNAGGGGGGDAHSMLCTHKLMPCQPYLRSATPPPPPSCCMSLKEMVDNDLMCLCSIFNNVDMLKSLNLTKENALDLPNGCGAKADVSKCKITTGGTTPTSPTISTGQSAAATSTTKSTSSALATNFVGISIGFASAMIVAKLFF